jgi:hypothetical protein
MIKQKLKHRELLIDSLVVDDMAEVEDAITQRYCVSLMPSVILELQLHIHAHMLKQKEAVMWCVIDLWVDEFFELRQKYYQNI